jgi:hypothetical protein
MELINRIFGLSLSIVTIGLIAGAIVDVTRWYHSGNEQDFRWLIVTLLVLIIAKNELAIYDQGRRLREIAKKLLNRIEHD